MMSTNLKNINLKEFPLPVQIFFIVFACSVVFYVVYGWDVSFLQRQLAASQQQEQDLKVQVEAFSNNLESINNDIAQLPELEELLNQWQTKLIKPQDLPDLLSEILKIGTNNGLVFDTFNPQAAVNEGVYIKIPIRVVAHGTYQEIATFLSQVANMSSIVVIGNFNLANAAATTAAGSTPPSADVAGNLTAELTLEVYYLATK